MLSNETQLAEIVKKYDITEDRSLWNQLVELEKKSNNPNIIIPVIGTQGMGKSTLINALMGEDILPNEADETTCVPVEIRYGDDRAEVCFSNGQVQEEPCDKRVLAQYVDNNYNHANEKGISKIVIHKKYDILKNGMVIVDLPGVGSLTRQNETTTTDYIQNLCVAVFLVPTSPPIMESQARFIKLVWRGVTTACFVQNIWFDNNSQEVKDGLAYNKNVLNEIAGEVGAELKRDIIPVNVYNAAKGAFTANKNLIESSNINALVKELDMYASNHTEITKTNFRERIKKTIESITSEIEKRIHQGQLSKEELLDELKTEREKFQKASDEIDAIIKDIKSTINDQRRDARRFAGALAEKKAELLRAEINQLIEGGVVDGEPLTKAFSDYQIQYGSEASDEAYDKLVEMVDILKEKMDVLKDVVKEECNTSMEAETFYKQKALKWEKGAQFAASIGGAVGGIFAGDAVAALLAGGSAAGPAGIAVAIGVAIIGSLIGAGIKRAKQKQRINETKQEMSKYIRDFEKNILNTISDSFETYLNGIADAVDEFKKTRQVHLEEINTRISGIMKSGNDIDTSIEVLKSDLSYVKNLEVEAL